MDKVSVRWVTLSLLIALSAILVNLSEWQLGFVAIVLIIVFLQGYHQDEGNQFGKRRNRRKRK